MSRLFEALQRSEPEGFALEFPQPDSPLNEILKTAQAPEPAPTGTQQLIPAPLNVLPEGRLVSLTEKDGLAAEKFRFLAVRLRQMRQTRPIQKLLITSTIPEEGKSMVSANLALTLARKKPHTVLLLEGDLRRPALAREFGMPNHPGLCEWLQSGTTQLPPIYDLGETGLCFLPAGHPPANPLELMQSGRLTELLAQLAGMFDWIVIDSPPVLPLGDTSVWVRLAEGVLLVAREGITEKRQLQRGLEALDKSKLLGTVLNGCHAADHDNYYQHYGPGAQAQDAPPPK